MRHFNKPLISLIAATLLTAAGSAQAFSFGDSSFSFGDDYYRGPYGSPYAGPGYGGNPYWIPPQMSTYDRSVMRMNRQKLMRDHAEALDDLGEMLNGRFGQSFDRDKAIQLAHRIESASGPALTQYFHPGAVAASGSHLSPAYWGNEKAFSANADTLQATATALATALAKVPDKDEKAVYLSKGRFGEDANKKVAVSPDVWQRFQETSNACRGCHASFRGPSW